MGGHLGKRLTASAAAKLREADKPIRPYISPSEINRGALAKWWGTIPPALSGIPLRELLVMSEFRDRVVEAEAETARKLKYGLPIDEDTRRFKGRGPRKGDTIVTGGRDDGW